MLRTVDFKCQKCGDVYEQIVPADRQQSNHCGLPAVKVWLHAPGVHYRRRYSHTLKHGVNSYAAEERELQKKGMWIASSKEANESYDTDHFTTPVRIQRERKEVTRKKVEKIAEQMVADGRLSFRQ